MTDVEKQMLNKILEDMSSRIDEIKRDLSKAVFNLEAACVSLNGIVEAHKHAMGQENNYEIPEGWFDQFAKGEL